MITNELAKIFIHAINGSLIFQGKNIDIDFSKPITFFGANFVIAGLVHTQIDRNGNRKPVYCSETCNEKDLAEVLPDANNGLLFFERVPNTFQVKKYTEASHYKNLINVSEKFNVIVWYDKCRLGFDKCCNAYPQISLQLIKALTLCEFNVTNDLVVQLSCETNKLKHYNVNLNFQDATFMSNDIFSNYDYETEKFVNGTCESIKLEFEVCYDMPLSCLNFPMYETSGVCDCLI